MGISRILLVAALSALPASLSLARENPPVVRDRATSAQRPAINKKLREAKRERRVAVVPTDIRHKRYLAFGDELDEQPGGVLMRHLIGGTALSDMPL